MEFNPYLTTTDFLRKQNLSQKQIDELISALYEVTRKQNCIWAARQYIIENDWKNDGRPYYNMWPAIIPMLLKIDLKFDSSMINPPLRALNIRLPKKGHPALPKIKTILFGNSININGTGKNGITIWVDRGESLPNRDLGFAMPIYTWQNFICEPGLSVEDSIKSLSSTGQQTLQEYETILECVKLVLGVCMIGAGQDENLISPDILSKDICKWNEAKRKGDQQALEIIQNRSARRKGPGWEIGKIYESHTDRPWIVPPHPQRYHTKEGVVLKLRSGWIKNREQVTNVPTGREDWQ